MVASNTRSLPRLIGLRSICLVALALHAVAALANANARICAYNFLVYDSGEFATRDPHLRTVLNGIDPDVLFAQEINNLVSAENVRDSVLNASGGTGFGDPFTLATTFDSTDNLDDFLYYRASKFSEVTASYVTIGGDPRPARRWRLRPVSDPSGANDIYIYGVHLKAGSTPSDETDRDIQTNAMRNNGNSLPAGTAIIYCGDFNFYDTEAAYFNFIESQADNDGRAWDPLNPNALNQNWSANGTYALMHTQSTHNNNPGQPSGAITGGLDDRFDFLLISTVLHDGTGQDYVANSYRAYGNDGLHFNDDINDPPTIPEGTTIANALHGASDHLPVYLDLTDPLSQPQIATTPASLVGFPQVLTGSGVTTDITVANNAPAPGNPLQYSFTPPAGFSAPAGLFNLNPQTNAQHTITLTDTSTSGTKMGTLTINNNSTPNPKNLTLIAVVLDHAVPSTAENSIVTIAPIDFGTHEIGQFTDQVATIYNADVPQFPNRVDLSVTSGTITNDPAGRFSLVGFAPPINAISTSANVTVNFNDAGAAAGPYTATLTFTTHDDTLAQGGTPLADIVFDLSATVDAPQEPIRGDFDLNFDVGLEDIDPFVAVLLDPDGATPEELWIADMNEDTMIDSIDLQPFVDAVLN